MAKEEPPKGAQTIAGIVGGAIVGAVLGGLIGAAIAALIGFGLGVTTEAEEAQQKYRSC